jgi:hypothetical protein
MQSNLNERWHDFAEHCARHETPSLVLGRSMVVAIEARPVQDRLSRSSIG